MNREEIKSMSPGRELDALVAEKVFDDPVFTDRHGNSGVRAEGGGYYDIPRYSSDISAAWEVVEHFKKKGWRVHMDENPDYTNVDLVRPVKSESFGNGWERVDGSTDKSAAEAICKAALLAVCVEDAIDATAQAQGTK